jgi:5-deoxy-5-amino-3-dehydroquinate dehydratase
MSIDDAFTSVVERTPAAAVPGAGSPSARPPGHSGEVLLLNGPNLGRLGERLPAIYGRTSLAAIEAAVAQRLASTGHSCRPVQSDAEGDLVRAVHAARDCVGAIINPGALMIAGWCLRDALEDFPAPWVEVHLSNIFAREKFRHESVLAPLASGIVSGFGAFGYLLAADAVVAQQPLTASR